ncbi:hypothetical protein UFOVP424_10 [uncultured Caudovirales phage]|uniref:Uncharacterized protein n=1 Tax=uncultured Caudovirales phage TaxID=2100421 RepID=A0A6J5M9I8_9CAUD|nr:hypothetical protein UFOVP424_10 [uncultured Caudovirales phage]
MAKSKLRGGKKEHNKRVAKRNEQLKKGHWELEMLKRKIYDEAKTRYEEEQNKQTEIKIKNDDGHNNS